VERYVISGGRQGYDRLAVLARAHGPDTAALFDRVGVRRGMHCLDLGCGGGAVTFELARRVGPQGHVVGVDADEGVLALAREAAAAQGVTNVEFQARSVYEGNGTESFDLVYCRFLLQHLSRPLDLLRSMLAAVRPGGIIVVEDADFDGLFCEPPDDGVDFFKRVYPMLLQRIGGDSTSGRKLYSYFLEVGIPQPDLKVVQLVHAVGEAKALRLLTLEAIADQLLAEALATKQEIEDAIASLTAYTDDPRTILGSPRVFQVWSTRDK
jgi:ubiquinone/menaquinone biosynthesis C-methylase UbiE